MTQGEERDSPLWDIDYPVRFLGSLFELFHVGRSVVSSFSTEKDSQGGIGSFFQIFSDSTETLGTMTCVWLSHPDTLVQVQLDLWRNYFNLSSYLILRLTNHAAQPIIFPSPKDKRFRDPAWTDNPCFDFIKQSYLVTAHLAEQLVENTSSLDEPTRQKAKFYIREIFHALSPSNFLPTNPELLRATLESKGENLVRGMKMLAEDIEPETGLFNMRQTDKTAFSLGTNLATTSGKVIYQNDIMQLIQYEANSPDVLKRPLLIIPPWINKFYILDLTPDNSFIRWCVEQGHTVFVISWVNPGSELASKSFSDYAREGIIEPLNVIEWVTGEKDINAIGYCIGGTLLATTLAYMAHMGDHRIKSATLFTTQVDFTHAGDLKVFIDEEQLVALEKDMKNHGFLDGYKMANIFNLLRSNELLWPYMLNNYVMGKSPPPFDLMFWNTDTTRIPAANHAFYLRECYLNNAIANGKMQLCGLPIDLKQVRIPIYNLAAKNDHIAPAKSVFEGIGLFGGPVDYVLTDAGHIAGVINPPARNKYVYWRNSVTTASYEEWFAHAEQHSGSWWVDWQAWIEKQDNRKVPARPIGGNGIKVLEDAPGSYVRVRSTPVSSIATQIQKDKESSDDSWVQSGEQMTA